MNDEIEDFMEEPEETGFEPDWDLIAKDERHEPPREREPEWGPEL